jgi:uncharacterized phage-like protein YoqJ
MIVAFTGHRPNKLGGYKIPNPTYNEIRFRIERKLIGLQPDKIISGMALGVDQWAAELAFALEIPFIAAIPFHGQESAWPTSSQETYKTLLKEAHEIVIVSEGGYSAHKMQIRNEGMVDHCDKLIAVWDGTPGGTANCVSYAKNKGKEIIRVNPT